MEITAAPQLLYATTVRTETHPPLTNCDGHGIFRCSTGTCYTGFNGYVGCCTVSSCAARTTCLPYNPEPTTYCNANTGGCTSCFNPLLPACFTIANALELQHTIYCATKSGFILTKYTNLVTTGSFARMPQVINEPPSTAPRITTSTHTSAISSISSSITFASSTSFTTPSPSFSSSAASATPSIFAPDEAEAGGSPLSLPIGSILGIIIGVMALMMAIGVLCCLIRHKRRSPDGKDYDDKMPFGGTAFRGFRSKPSGHDRGAAELEGSSAEINQAPWGPESFNELLAASQSGNPAIVVTKNSDSNEAVSKQVPSQQASTEIPEAMIDSDEDPIPGPSTQPKYRPYRPNSSQAENSGPELPVSPMSPGIEDLIDPEPSHTADLSAVSVPLESNKDSVAHGKGRMIPMPAIQNPEEPNVTKSERSTQTED